MREEDDERSSTVYHANGRYSSSPISRAAIIPTESSVILHPRPSAPDGEDNPPTGIPSAAVSTPLQTPISNPLRDTQHHVAAAPDTQPRADAA